MDKSGKYLPHYSIRVEGETQFLYDDKDLAKVVAEHEKKRGTKVDAADTETKQDNIHTQLDIVEFYESAEMEEIIGKVKKMGFDIDTIVSKEEDTLEQAYIPRAARKKSAKASRAERKKKSEFKNSPYKTVCGDVTLYHDSLLEVLACVREEARKGMTISRYKGLGEMNPDQLWETTMNPATRTLVQVHAEDAAKADEIFSILMGDEVAPRKSFIQEYAREVQNLDI